MNSRVNRLIIRQKKKEKRKKNCFPVTESSWKELNGKAIETLNMWTKNPGTEWNFSIAAWKKLTTSGGERSRLESELNYLKQIKPIKLKKKKKKKFWPRKLVGCFFLKDSSLKIDPRTSIIFGKSLRERIASRWRRAEHAEMTNWRFSSPIDLSGWTRANTFAKIDSIWDSWTSCFGEHKIEINQNT